MTQGAAGMEFEWRRRMEEKMDRLLDAHADLGQIRENITFIFSPDGPWKTVTKQVSEHETFIQRARGAGWLMGLMGLGWMVTTYQWLKVHVWK